MLKNKTRLLIDIVMMILSMISLGYQITGNAIHEWLGTIMILFWILHHVINIKWYTSLFKGKYKAYRIVHTLLNMLLLIAMVLMIISGIILSREVFGFIRISNGISLARSMHLCSAYWSFVLMFLHLGFHFDQIMTKFNKMNLNAGSKRIIQVICLIMVLYGVYVFVHDRFYTYMFLTSSFVFLDPSRSIFLFVLDHICVMAIFIFIAYWGKQALIKIK